jgi:hypothetical protein
LATSAPVSSFCPFYRTLTLIYFIQTKVCVLTKILVKVSNIKILVEILTILKTFNTIKAEYLFGLGRGEFGMSTHENELFKIISESKNPEQAVLTAIEIFTAFLEPPEAVPELPAVCLQESF